MPRPRPASQVPQPVLQQAFEQQEKALQQAQLEQQAQALQQAQLEQQAQALPFARRGSPAGVTQAESNCRVWLMRGQTRQPASMLLSQPWRRSRSSPSPPGARPKRFCVSVVGASSVTRACNQSTRALRTGSPCCRLRPRIRTGRCGALRVRRQPLSLILWSTVDTRARKRSVARLNLGPSSTLWIAPLIA